MLFRNTMALRNGYVPLNNDLLQENTSEATAERQRGYHKVDTSQPQFTWRAIIVGLLFGTILCFSNLWFGLQSGWISMMSLQSSLVGFAVFKALNTCWIFPLARRKTSFFSPQPSPQPLCRWPAGGALAVSTAVAVGPQDNSAAVDAHQIRRPRTDPEIEPVQEDADGDRKFVDDVEWVTKLLSLLVAFLLSGCYALLAYFFPVISALPGIIMGLPTCIWMLVGSIVGWGVLSPMAKNAGWAPGPVTDWKDGSRGWILWISLAVMIAESVVSLGLVSAKEMHNLFDAAAEDETQDGLPARQGAVKSVDISDDEDVDPRFLIPGWITWGGLAASTLLCMGIVYAYSASLSVLLALPLAVLGVRALGETDLNPVSGIGKVSQVVFAGIMPGNLVGNLVAGGIAEAGAQQAGDLMQDLKTGHLLNASPRAQFAGQMIGSVFSVFVTAGAYLLYNKVYPIPGPQFPVPTAQVWLDMARLSLLRVGRKSNLPFVLLRGMVVGKLE
ncbi:OPT oligopeptide transporter protein-domain-containing protein [Kickxella alabastrina]|uniref:OPT oligopeptide transporter protein-domain-containing protein n=1 Tax=Kickxella alabastrina TaxID=61397 RepID=UPI00221F3A00|nr:OPT oligopeptide transporter protein-domain-containing protein [Kickxella alabastrina]KAI7826718.1 OPT oligopeptide transporter protein-domain-containing protein [Kickxella alabastrina]